MHTIFGKFNKQNTVLLVVKQHWKFDFSIKLRDNRKSGQFCDRQYSNIFYIFSLDKVRKCSKKVQYLSVYIGHFQRFTKVSVEQRPAKM